MQKKVLVMALLAANQVLAAGVDPKTAGGALEAAGAKLEEVSIIGDPKDAQQIPGAAYVLTKAELQKFEYTDINRMVRKVPGVYLQEEDGFGLRPNIGIRGAVGERSSKINLMEDGVLIAPAPYSAPSAYYFPTAGRMQGIEVLKGAETLRYGPSTVGGAVNMISRRIPNVSGGEINAEGGKDGAFRVNGAYGLVDDNYAVLLETHQQGNDGYKSIDRSDRDTGFYIEDYMAKLRLNSDADAEYYQQLDIKFQYSEELSDETYFGLSDADFKADPDRRYGLSKLDEMQTRHTGFTVRHKIEFNQDLSLSSTFYYNKFKRDWFKVKGVGGLIDTVNEGGSNAAAAQAQLNGTADLAGVAIKHNNREYLSKGLELRLDWQLADHALEMGVRVHEDDVDRYQPEEIYNQVDGELVFQNIKYPSSSNNRVGEAEALALHVMDVWSVNDALELRMGLRYEDIDTQQTRYNDSDTSDQIHRDSIASTRKNSVDELLWSIGATYDVAEHLQILAGAHAGFAPSSPSSRENIDPETSTNYEFGVRYQGDVAQVSAIAFLSDFESTVTNCTVARPCGGQTIGSESEGESEVKGLEFAFDTTVFQNDQMVMPLSISYTYTDAEITDPKNSSNLKGDWYEYLPENTFNAQLGLELSSGWNSYINAAYVDEMCTDSSLCGRAGSDEKFAYTDNYWVVDFSSHYSLNTNTQLYLKLDNVLDKRAIVARDPESSVRPNKPRTASVGVKYTF